jgi:hypothetical protein
MTLTNFVIVQGNNDYSRYLLARHLTASDSATEVAAGLDLVRAEAERVRRTESVGLGGNNWNQRNTHLISAKIAEIWQLSPRCGGWPRWILPTFERIVRMGHALHHKIFSNSASNRSGL